jgi:hypothetical protein
MKDIDKMNLAESVKRRAKERKEKRKQILEKLKEYK